MAKGFSSVAEAPVVELALHHDPLAKRTLVEPRREQSLALVPPWKFGPIFGNSVPAGPWCVEKLLTQTTCTARVGAAITVELAVEVAPATGRRQFPANALTAISVARAGRTHPSCLVRPVPAVVVVVAQPVSVDAVSVAALPFIAVALGLRLGFRLAQAVVLTSALSALVERAVAGIKTALVGALDILPPAAHALNQGIAIVAVLVAVVAGGIRSGAGRRCFVRTVTAIVVFVAHPALRDALAVVAFPFVIVSLWLRFKLRLRLRFRLSRRFAQAVVLPILGATLVERPVSLIKAILV